MSYSKPMALEIGSVEHVTLGGLKLHEGIDAVQLPRDTRVDIAEIDEFLQSKHMCDPDYVV